MSAIVQGIAVGLAEIGSHKFRSGLSMLGIVFGVAAVIAAVSIGEGMRDSVVSQFGEISAVDQINIRGEPRWIRTRTGWVRNEHPDQLTRMDVEAMSRTMAGGRVLRVMPEVSGTKVARVGRVARGVDYLGVTGPGATNRDWNVVAGRDLVALDGATQARVCLVGATVAEDFFPDQRAEEIPGRELRLGNTRLTVVGVLGDRGKTLFQDLDDLIVVPLETAQRYLHRSDDLSRIVLQLADPADAAIVERWARSILAVNHQGGANFQIDREEQILERIDHVTLLINLTLGGIAGVSLLVGGIGIMNVMLASVTERTREIGIRKAVGARSRDVLAQFLIESATVTVVGGMGGVALGIGLGRVLGWGIGSVLEEQIQPGFSPPVLILAVVFSGAVGLFFGIMPARRAARLDPILSLRFE